MPNAPTLPGRSALPVVLVLLWLTAGWAGTPLPATGAAGDEATGTDSGNVDFELSYNSIFTQYHTFRDEAISSWPEANDTVGRIGGWRSYLEEAAEPEPPATGEPLPTHGPPPAGTTHPPDHGGQP
ncbi:MAG: hypothetical protein KA768_04415 [Desulfobulbus sp.]|uniref:hypothetical protein n=1 Tax=uncultured Desulfobulbus sp. TaxID=239745 RepID=UPI001B557885|nr:hypothetical protein [uncultured Desulfobulbus sp.]MBP7517054.1 hypothetical protein [Desulfobulbus sp.]